MFILIFLGGAGIGLSLSGFVLIQGRRYDKGVPALVAGGVLTLVSALGAYMVG